MAATVQPLRCIYRLPTGQARARLGQTTNYDLMQERPISEVPSHCRRTCYRLGFAGNRGMDRHEIGRGGLE